VRKLWCFHTVNKVLFVWYSDTSFQQIYFVLHLMTYYLNKHSFWLHSWYYHLLTCSILWNLQWAKKGRCMHVGRRPTEDLVWDSVQELSLCPDSSQLSASMSSRRWLCIQVTKHILIFESQMYGNYLALISKDHFVHAWPMLGFFAEINLSSC